MATKDWEEVESGNRHNGFFVGSFFVQWALDSGYVDLHLKKPTDKDRNWYLKIVYPRVDGQRYKTTIKAGHFEGIICCIESNEVIELNSWEVWGKLKGLLQAERDRLTSENAKDIRNLLHEKLRQQVV